MTRARLVLLVNPKGGLRQGPAIATSVSALLRAAGYEVELHETRAPGHASELARTLPLEGCAGLCAVGGDGTIHEVIEGWLARDASTRPPLGLIPAGGGNSLAHDLGCVDPSEAARRIAAGRVREIDLMRARVGGRTLHAFNVIAWGLSAAITRRGESMRLIGKHRYTLAALIELLLLRVPDFEVDGRATEGRYLLGAACNTRHVGAGMQLAPRAVMDDGLLDLVLIKKGPRARLARILRDVFTGAHLGSDLVEYRQCRSFELELAPGAGFMIDGELAEAGATTVEVLPRALRLLA